MSKFSQLSFCQKLFFIQTPSCICSIFIIQTPSCICSMCLHCIDKNQIVLSKAVVEVDRPMKALSMRTQSLIRENCLSAHSCHFAKIIIF